MKATISLFIILLCSIFGFTQQEFHVTTDGNSSGDGSIKNPWDLQTALQQKPEKIKGGDIIYLHGGIYTGRFLSTINGPENNKIIVESFPGEWAILNGNVASDAEAVLTVRGKNVIFKNFEISPTGITTREKKNPEFRQFAGIMHLSGTNCEFINLRIHGNIGLGIGSWKATGGTKIINCQIYNNGFFQTNGNGGGEGIYVQNESDNETRIIKDNVIFNNYYKGIEVWSASKHAEREWVKNIHLENNVIFNNGLPANRPVDNIIIGTDDRDGNNIAKNIIVKNNILYHNTDFLNNETNGDAPSLTIGFHSGAPVENVVVNDNVILGKNNGLRLLYATSLKFQNNVVYSGYVHSNVENFSVNSKRNWEFKNNFYYTKNNTPLRIINDKKYSSKEWMDKYKLDAGSKWERTNTLDLKNVLNITQNVDNPNIYRIVVFNKNSENVEVDLSQLKRAIGTSFVIRDFEKFDEILKSSELTENPKIYIPMTSGDKFKTLSNFGVFQIEFNPNSTETPKETIIDRLLDILGRNDN